MKCKTGSIMIAVIVAVLIAIVGTHLILSIMIWRKYTLPYALLQLAGLSILTTISWLLLAWLLIYYSFFSSTTPDWTEALDKTLGLPFDIDCALFSHLPELPTIAYLPSCRVYISLLM